MNLTIRPRRARFGALVFLSGSFASLLPCAVATATASAAPANEAEKNYHLFVGADVLVGAAQDLHRVNGVSRGSFVVDTGRRTELVAMDKSPLNLRVDPTMRLTMVSATVDHLAGERAYTPANDPARKYARQQMGSSGEAQAALSLGTLNQANTELAGARSAMDHGGGQDAARSMAQAQTDVNTATQAVDKAYFDAGSDLNNSGQIAGRMQSELDRELFDALEVKFDVSSSFDLEKPYVVVIATYRDPGSRPGQVRNWIYAREMAPIGAKPVTVSLLQGGFPPGYQLVTYQVHVYNNGTEVATNVAPHHVALTRDDAFQYVVADYLGTHRGATLPASLAWTTPAAVGAAATWTSTPTVYLKVARNGKPAGIFLDPACERRAEDASVSALIEGLRFKPALSNGKPIESVTSLDLRKLTS